MSNDPRLEPLLDKLLDSEASPEQICDSCPELLPEVRRRWQEIKRVRAELDVLFPPSIWPQEDRPTFPFEDTPLPTLPGYEVEEVIGRGGVGVVFKAVHLRLNRPVAVKMLLSGQHASPVELERFLREAEAVAGLHHPNVVDLYDVGEVDGRPYFTMEFIEGGSLARELVLRPMPAREAAALVAQVTEAIEWAHQSGIIHRDLKPGNVLLTADGTPKVADFGLARLENDAGLTLSGAPVGTPSYMAPEQARGDKAAIGPATDVYALGAILYECLTGRPPFRAETSTATLHQVLVDEPVGPAQLNPRIPRDAETICLKCLEKDPHRRYASAAALADELHRFERGEPILARPIGHVARAYRWARRRPTAAALAAAIFTIALLALTLTGVELRLSGQREAATQAAQQDLHEADQHLQQSDLSSAQAALERARGRLGEGGPPELQQRVEQIEAALALHRQMEVIRLRRSALFIDEARTFNRASSDRDYEDAFRAAGLGTDRELAETVAARVSDALDHKALVAALDDWASCTADPRRRAWLLEVARLADPDPWRDRARDAATWEDRAKLTELTEAAPVTGQPLNLLLAVGERLQLSGGDARPFLWRVQQQHPGDFWANRALGDALYLHGEHALSIGFFQMALALRPDTAVANSELGEVLMGTGREDEAIFYFERALEFDPLSSRNHINLADALTTTGKPNEAERHYREALRLVPQTTLGRRSVAIALERSRRENDAQALFEQNVHLHPRDEECRRDLALHLARRGLLDEAAVQFRAAVDINPNSVMAHADLGRLLRDRGRLDEAAEHFDAALSINPKSVMALHDLGSLLLASGRPGDATDYLRRGAALEPFNGLIQADLRAALIRQDRLEEARAAWQNAIDASPTEHDAWFGYAELCLFLGHEDEYRRHRIDLLSRFSGSETPAVCERTGRACLLLPAPERELAQAVALIERAVATGRAGHEFAYPYRLFALGLARYRQGRFDDAIEVLSGEAASVMGPSPRLILAMAQHYEGETDEAQKSLAAASASYDWNANATDHDAWIAHILRREAEALILEEMPASLKD